MANFIGRPYRSGVRPPPPTPTPPRPVVLGNSYPNAGNRGGTRTGYTAAPRPIQPFSNAGQHFQSTREGESLFGALTGVQSGFRSPAEEIALWGANSGRRQLPYGETEGRRSPGAFGTTDGRRTPDAVGGVGDTTAWDMLNGGGNRIPPGPPASGGVYNSPAWNGRISGGGYYMPQSGGGTDWWGNGGSGGSQYWPQFVAALARWNIE